MSFEASLDSSSMKKLSNLLLAFAIFLVIILLVITELAAQISLPSTVPVTENFDAMGCAAGASAPANRKMSPFGGGGISQPYPQFTRSTRFVVYNQ